ncbi:hypothetical protein FB451DRAFT_1191531 [Mycena latifolia]|nr:hypothetical protein FB451DRAFT_1191531 [Mycena latifolia]
MWETQGNVGECRDTKERSVSLPSATNTGYFRSSLLYMKNEFGGSSASYQSRRKMYTICASLSASPEELADHVSSHYIQPSRMDRMELSVHKFPRKAGALLSVGLAIPVITNSATRKEAWDYAHSIRYLGMDRFSPVVHGMPDLKVKCCTPPFAIQFPTSEPREFNVAYSSSAAKYAETRILDFEKSPGRLVNKERTPASWTEKFTVELLKT